MPNLEFLENVTHRGTVLKKGVIVSDAQQGLASVAQNLIDRKLAKETEAAATHSAALVNSVQEPMPITAAAGEGQKANAEIDEGRKAEAQAEQLPADKAIANQVADEAAKVQPSIKDRLLGRTDEAKG